MRDIILAKLFGHGSSTPGLTWDDLGRGIVPVFTHVDDFTTTFDGASGSGKFWAMENPKLTAETLIGLADYLVTFDGVEYVVTAKKYEDAVYFFLGNAHIYRDDMDDTGEPFCIGAQGTRNYVALTNTPGVHTYKIQRLGEGIIPIPEEYLPQGAGGGGNVTLRDVISTDTVVLDNETLEFEEEEGEYWAFIESDAMFSMGDTITVVWDGVRQECTAKQSLDGYIFFVGDGFELYPEEGEIWVSASSAGTHTISISGKLINPIPPEYLDLPEPETEIAQFYFSYDTNTGSVTTMHENVYDQIREAFMAKKIVIAHLARYSGENGANGSSATLIGQEAWAGTALFAGTVYNSGGLWGNLVLDVQQNGTMHLGRGNLYLKSSQSTKVFKISVDDSGTLSASEVTF